jgi:hypothetical protein
MLSDLAALSALMVSLFQARWVMRLQIVAL